MKTIALILALLLPICVAADSLWDDMQHGDVNPIVGKVKLDPRSDQVRIIVTKAEGGDPITLHLCSAADGGFNSYYSEEERAVFTTQKLERLRDAEKNKTEVTLSVRGPWNPCVESVSN